MEQMEILYNTSAITVYNYLGPLSLSLSLTSVHTHTQKQI